MALTLAQVETAIEEVLTKGQSITTDGQTWTAANLYQLRELRKTMQAQEAGDPLSRAVAARPRR